VTAPNSDPLVGRTIGQYEILARIGGGGMGVVYSARDGKLGRTVALKFLPPQWSHDESAKQRFLREAQAASATNHPSICTIHDIETADDGQLFIVMAYYEGQTLKQRLESGPLPIDEALEISTQLADGLAKAHAQGVVHRDIKPGNLMLTEDGVRILDFGLATFADAVKLTAENTIFGTVAYMSPEQVRGFEADARSDVWAAGAVLYEMLAGHPPFRGSHAEAIGYAIRNEAPEPIRAERPEVPEDVEQLVFRALHKEASVRYQSGRELARALRQVRGLTLPVTEPVPVVRPVPKADDERPHRGKLWAGIGAAVLVGAAALAWNLWPVERMSAIIVPVVNQTGYAELDDYRLALTQALVMEVSESPNIRVMPYRRLEPIVRAIAAQGIDMSSREAVQVLSTQSGARFLIVPTLVYQSGTWRGRAEIQAADTATNTAVIETAPIASSLVRDTAYTLATDLALRVQEYFKTNGPGRSYPSRSASSRFRSLDAARLFEQGVSAFDQLEYDAAQRFLSQARALDSRNALVAIWLSRAERMLRHDDAASEAAESAERLLTSGSPEADAAFVNAVVTETRSDWATAEERYRSLTKMFADEPLWRIELGAFQDRRGEIEAAVVTYQQALVMDARLARADVELCRLYNRLNDRANARKHGQDALTKFGAAHVRWGEAQAHFCLTDVLRFGTTSERQEARQHADTARTILEQIGATYNLSRALFYSGLGLAEQGDLSGSVVLWEKAVAAARSARNRTLEPLVLMNLGVANARLGNRREAMNYYRESSDAYQALGDGARASQVLVNRAQLGIDFGPKPAEAFRDAQNALAVFVKSGDRNWQVFSRQALASYYRLSGRYVESEQELNQALAIARERNLTDHIAALNIDIARARFAMSDYVGALKKLQTVGDDAGQHTLHARIWIGRVYSRLGDFAQARMFLERAEENAAERKQTEYLPLLYEALGELEYETGRLDQARSDFDKASTQPDGDLADPASVESSAWIGLLEMLKGSTKHPRFAVESSLRRAVLIQHAALEARCRIILARILQRDKDYAGMLRALDETANGRASASGPELVALMHHWRAEANAGMGQKETSADERAQARKLLDGLRGSLPEAYRDGFAGRSDIRASLD